MDYTCQHRQKSFQNREVWLQEEWIIYICTHVLLHCGWLTYHLYNVLLKARDTLHQHTHIHPPTYIE